MTRSRLVARLLALSLLLVAGQAAARPMVAVLEFRSGARGAAGVGEKVAQLLAANAAVDVLGPGDARRKDARIDAAVARCNGEAMCIGALGEQLGASEVLLIGVSQLGDLVLALQRIDAKKGVAAARLAESVGVNDEITDAMVLGWLRQLFPPELFKRYGQIRVVADLAGAEVRINDEARGKTPLDLLKVRAPGSYKVRLSKAGYVPFEAGIDVLPDATVEVNARMQREAGQVPWYKRWYVWAAVGGAAAAVGVGLAVYYGTRVDPNPLGYIVTPPRPAALGVSW